MDNYVDRVGLQGGQHLNCVWACWEANTRNSVGLQGGQHYDGILSVWACRDANTKNSVGLLGGQHYDGIMNGGKCLKLIDIHTPLIRTHGYRGACRKVTAPN